MSNIEKANDFADRVIADRAPAGEPVAAGPVFVAFVAACRHTSDLASRKSDVRDPVWKRSFWSAVRLRAVNREVEATNRAVAAFDAANAARA